MSHLLDDRLVLAASMVRKGVRVADVGCDHAYLSIYLVENEIASSVIASDVRTGPLESARNNIASKNLNAKIKTMLTNGLDGIYGSMADDVVICGMGGILICDILSRAAFLKDTQKRLVLQPMTDTELVRNWLYLNGFEILTERAVKVSGHIYSVINAAYTGEKLDFDDISVHLGGLLRDATDMEYEYIKKYVKTLKTRLSGKQSAKNIDNAEVQQLEKLIARIEGEIK